jgi:hypothetical protein
MDNDLVRILRKCPETGPLSVSRVEVVGLVSEVQKRREEQEKMVDLLARVKALIPDGSCGCSTLPTHREGCPVVAMNREVERAGRS